MRWRERTGRHVRPEVYHQMNDRSTVQLTFIKLPRTSCPEVCLKNCRVQVFEVIRLSFRRL